MSILQDGFPIFYTFASIPAASFEEQSVTPPSVQGGGSTDTTTMRNVGYRTKAPKKLKTLGDSSVTVVYDPEIYDEVLAQLQANQLVTITFPDTSTYAFYGWIDDFTPGEVTEGSQPTASITVIPSLRDNAGVQTAPVFTAAV